MRQVGEILMAVAPALGVAFQRIGDGARNLGEPERRPGLCRARQTGVLSVECHATTSATKGKSSLERTRQQCGQRKLALSAWRQAARQGLTHSKRLAGEIASQAPQ